MKVEIKLKDNRYCNGCPLLQTNRQYWFKYCNRYY